MVICCIHNNIRLAFVVIATTILYTMANPLSDNQLNAWKSLLNAHAAAVGAIEARLHASGKIPLTWYDVLWSLHKAGGHLRFRALQDEIVLSRSALSRSVDALARRKLVRKEACPDDQRGVEVVLTEAGKSALADAWPVYSSGIKEHFARHFTDDECGRLAAILGRVLPTQ